MWFEALKNKELALLFQGSNLRSNWGWGCRTGVEQDLLYLEEGRQRNRSRGRGCRLSVDMSQERKWHRYTFDISPADTGGRNIGFYFLGKWRHSSPPHFLFFSLSLLPIWKFFPLPSSLIPLANTLLNYHVLSDCPISIMTSAFLLPAVVSSVVAKGEIRYSQNKSQGRGG